MKMDIPVVVIGLSLMATIVAFLTGVFPYPYGFIILTVALAARVLQLKSRG